MNSKKIVYSAIKTIIALIIFVTIAMFVYKLCTKAYDFGYRIFAEEPMSPAPGFTVSVAIVEGKSVMEIGEILEEKGLIRSAYLFYCQELVSNFHGQIKPGVYELNTSMTIEEMLQIMSATPENLEPGEGEESDYIEGADDYPYSEEDMNDSMDMDNDMNNGEGDGALE